MSSCASIKKPSRCLAMYRLVARSPFTSRYSVIERTRDRHGSPRISARIPCQTSPDSRARLAADSSCALPDVIMRPEKSQTCDRSSCSSPPDKVLMLPARSANPSNHVTRSRGLRSDCRSPDPSLRSRFVARPSRRITGAPVCHYFSCHTVIKSITVVQIVASSGMLQETGGATEGL
jgi:hypothetical protein